MRVTVRTTVEMMRENIAHTMTSSVKEMTSFPGKLVEISSTS